MDNNLYKREISPTDTLLRLKEVICMVKYSKQGIYKLMRKNQFPRPIALGERRVCWIQAEVLAFMNERLTERNTKIETQKEKDIA